MKTARFLQKDSIATQLIKVVFACYCIVAVLVTVIQILMEYQHAKNQISAELAINQKIFEPVLSSALWNLDIEQIQVTINGMLEIPVISGIKIEQGDKLLTAVGHILDDRQTTLSYSKAGKRIQEQGNDSKLISYGFPVNYVFRDQARLVGKATVYSDTGKILSRVELNILLLVINAVIKTVTLWLLFYYFGRYILLQPLSKLVAAIEAVDLQNVDTFKLDLQSKQKNELTLIEDAFEQMLEKLAQARNKIMDLNSNLEAKVQQRTLDLNIAKEDAELANRAKTIFMSRINHELRTPLNAIVGCSHILEKMLEGEQYEKQRSLLGHTVDAAEHLLMLFEDIIDVVVNEGKELDIPMHNCDLNEIIHASVVMVTPEAQARDIAIKITPTQATAYANSGRVRQVLLNLLSNAIKFNKPGGQIQIDVEQSIDRKINILVKDTGVGIKEADLKRIFEPLHRLDYAEQNEVGGTGMGLSIVKHLLERMQGSIDVRSLPGRGSEFIVTLTSARREICDDDLYYI